MSLPIKALHRFDRLVKAPNLTRYTSHLTLIALLFALSSTGNLDVNRLPLPVENGPEVVSTPLPLLNSRTEGGLLTKLAMPLTTVQARARELVVTYVVQSGDTVTGIAGKFGLMPETIFWSNEDLEWNPDLLFVGQELMILPVDGVYHKVTSGDTLESIAKQYKVDASTIAGSRYNQLSEPYELRVGQRLVIPGGTKPYSPQVVRATYAGSPPPGAAKGSGNFGYPTSGAITQYFWGGHRAIDIGAPCGTSVYASDSGYVAAVGWLGGYGNRVLISHGNGWETVYAHLSMILVQAGTSVQAGQLIGRVGTTGHSTGCHLHFELLQYGVKRNPMGFLR